MNENLTPSTRYEAFLDKIANAIGGGSTGGSSDGADKGPVWILYEELDMDDQQDITHELYYNASDDGDSVIKGEVISVDDVFSVVSNPYVMLVDKELPYTIPNPDTNLEATVYKPVSYYFDKADNHIDRMHITCLDKTGSYKNFIVEVSFN